MKRQLSALLVVSIVALGFYGCGESQKQGGNTPELPSALDVPMPPEAKTGVVGSNSADYASYEMPISWTAKQLLDFYDEKMPRNEDWEGWPYCGTRGGPKKSDGYLTRLYRTPENLQLDVNVVFGGSDPVGAIIQRTKLSPNPEPC